MLMTDKGKLIRIPVTGIRITGRNTQGVKLFHTDEDEHVVGAVRLADAAEDEEIGEVVDLGDAGEVGDIAGPVVE